MIVTAFPKQPTESLIPAPHGQLAIMTTPILHEPMIAIICHPHPLHGGTMHNKVVTTTAKACQQQGYATVRFNYRGVGGSSGSYGDFIGEIADLETVIAWVMETVPHAKLSLAGFSFGAFIAASVADKMSDIDWLISIAPAVNHANFSALTKTTAPWLVVQGEADEVVSSESVCAWANQNPAVKACIRIPSASHFFHGQLLQLRQVLEEWIKSV